MTFQTVAICWLHYGNRPEHFKKKWKKKVQSLTLQSVVYIPFKRLRFFGIIKEVWEYINEKMERKKSKLNLWLQ